MTVVRSRRLRYAVALVICSMYLREGIAMDNTLGIILNTIGVMIFTWIIVTSDERAPNTSTVPR